LFPITLVPGFRACRLISLSRDLASVMARRGVRDAGVRRAHHLLQEVFIPLTISAATPAATAPSCTHRGAASGYLTPEQVLDIARGSGQRRAPSAVHPGRQPELKWKARRRGARSMAMPRRSTIRGDGRAVFKETGLLPHFNPD